MGRIIAVVISLFAAPVVSAQTVTDSVEFEQLIGTWAHVKDGLSLTTDIRPILGGTALQVTGVLDDNNQSAATVVFTRDREGRWTRTWFDRDGHRSTFVSQPGGPSSTLLQITFDGRALEPSPSRLVYSMDRPDTFMLDWQSRSEDGSWTPRPEVFVHHRVDRPPPPASPGRIAFISNRDGNWEIYTMAPDGSDVVNLTNHARGDHYPRWIAGGTRIAFRSQRGRDDDGWDRWEIDRDGTDAEFVDLPGRLANKDFGAFPQVSPSGSWVVYAAERDSEQDLHISRFDGGGERVLAPAPGLDYRARWSPDGTRVVFVSERDGNPELYTVHPDGSALTRLTDNPGNDRYAQWSPDGRRIAFASSPGDDDELDLYVMNADGTGKRRLTDSPGEEGEISWSPDGAHLAFRTDMFGNSEVAIVELATGEITNLSRNDAYDAEPIWSP